MKIYCIKIDSMPYIPKVVDYNNLVRGELRRTVTGCYTLSSMVQKFTGKISSDLEPHGFGHWLWEDKKDSNGKVVWPWKKQFVLYNLKEKGYKLHLRNWTEFLTHFGMENEFDSVSSILDGRDGDYVFPSRWGSEFALKYTLGDNPEIDNLEKEYIEGIQKEKGNNFYFINYNHFHVACQWSQNIKDLVRIRTIAENKVNKLLEFWDFEEPNSVFWIYSDHGYWFHPTLDKFPEFCHFLTWTIVKDNISKNIKLPLVLSIQDFREYIMAKLNNTNLKTRKVFFTEDGRDVYSPKSMSTAIACSLNQNMLDSVAYHCTTDEWSGSNDKLKTSLREKFDWVP